MNKLLDKAFYQFSIEKEVPVVHENVVARIHCHELPHRDNEYSRRCIVQTKIEISENREMDMHEARSPEAKEFHMNRFQNMTRDAIYGQIKNDLDSIKKELYYLSLHATKAQLKLIEDKFESIYEEMGYQK